MWPNVMSIYWAFTDYTGIGPTQNFIGLANFRTMMVDTRWWEAVGNTLYIAGGTILTILPFSLLFAVLMLSVKYGQSLFKFTVYLPSILPLVIVALLFVFILDPTIGLLDAFMNTLGIKQNVMNLLSVNNLNWLGNLKLARPTIVGITLWQALGFYVILFLAGLSKIPPELYDAAKIDGAKGWSLFQHITWPLLFPTTQTVFLLLIINSLQNFTLIYALAGGSPTNANQVMATYVYRIAFRDNQYGYATALSVVMMIMISVITITSREVTKRETVQF